MTRYLLDTHAALFWWSGSKRLGGRAFEAIANPISTVMVSAASAWEVSTKFRIGKLTEFGDPSVAFPRLIARNGFIPLDVTMAHALRAGALPGTHGDAFDRMIAAQALVERAIVLTRDPEIAAFGCETVW